MPSHPQLSLEYNSHVNPCSAIPSRIGSPLQACQPALVSATVHGDALSHASNGHIDHSSDSPSGSFPALDAATGFDVSHEPIMGTPLLAS